MISRPAVVADAGPLIGLSRISRLHILKDLFGEVVVTPEIRDEILPPGAFPGAGEIEKAIADGWLRVEGAAGDYRLPANPGVDRGEASVLAFVEARPGSLVIMDDRAGRTEAKSRGLTAIGTAAVVGLAREHRLIDSARGVLGELVGAGYFIPAEVIEAIARRVDSQ